jgi:hypothetical protein
MAAHSHAARILRHLLIPAWIAERPFDQRMLRNFEAAIARSEQSHDGELRLAIEGPLPFALILRGHSARARAVEMFSRLRVWDTEHNSGVLIYLQMVDRRVEVIADRGIAAKVDQPRWNAICRSMEQAFARAQFEQGVLSAINEITTLLAANFPAAGANPNELPDKPVML